MILEINKNVPQDVRMDSSRLQQVILNLFSNALKFTSKGFIKLKLNFLTASN